MFVPGRYICFDLIRYRATIPLLTKGCLLLTSMHAASPKWNYLNCIHELV